VPSQSAFSTVAIVRHVLVPAARYWIWTGIGYGVRWPKFMCPAATTFPSSSRAAVKSENSAYCQTTMSVRSLASAMKGSSEPEPTW
jgi:hypothetical protein